MAPVKTTCFPDLQMVTNWKDVGFILNIGTAASPKFVENRTQSGGNLQFQRAADVMSEGRQRPAACNAGLAPCGRPTRLLELLASNPPRSSTFVVIGGGPAGSATAISARAAGRRAHTACGSRALSDGPNWRKRFRPTSAPCCNNLASGRRF
jgi:hypothetical protein